MPCRETVLMNMMCANSQRSTVLRIEGLSPSTVCLETATAAHAQCSHCTQCMQSGYGRISHQCTGVCCCHRQAAAALTVEHSFAPHPSSGLLQVLVTSADTTRAGRYGAREPLSSCCASRSATSAGMNLMCSRAAAAAQIRIVALNTMG
jgi:hypothetical protein